VRALHRLGQDVARAAEWLPSERLGAQYLRFNLHAGVSIPGGLPAARERLLRYCARPPLALERLSVLDDGRICYRIKDTEQVRLMTPMQFMARLAALVPPPRHPLVRYYGAWAPHSQWRSLVVPVASHQTLPACTEPSALSPPPCPPAERVSVAVTRSQTASSHDPSDLSTPEPNLASSTPNTPSVAAMPIAASAPLAPAREVAHEPRFARLSRLNWATWPGRAASCAVGTSRRNRRPCRGRALPTGPTDGAILPLRPQPPADQAAGVERCALDSVSVAPAWLRDTTEYCVVWALCYLY
jgi:Putative transposase